MPGTCSCEMLPGSCCHVMLESVWHGHGEREREREREREKDGENDDV